jgi:hypothetical protein
MTLPDSFSCVRIFSGIALVAVLMTFSFKNALAGDLLLVPEVRHELNLVLKTGDILHKSLLTQDEEQIDLSLRDVLVQLTRARGSLIFAKPHERRHLVRIIDAAYEQFELTQSTFGDERRLRLTEAYNQQVNLVRIYHVDKAYGIFFCPKDRTTWVQRGLKVHNPFHPDDTRESCGIRVTR